MIKSTIFWTSGYQNTQQSLIQPALLAATGGIHWAGNQRSWRNSFGSAAFSGLLGRAKVSPCPSGRGGATAVLVAGRMGCHGYHGSTMANDGYGLMLGDIVGDTLGDALHDSDNR